MTTIPWFYPMGGNSDEKRLEKGIWTDKSWIVERKYDGSRYLLRKEMDGTLNLTSRSKSVETGLPTNKIDNIPHLVKIADKLRNGTILDGEIITHINCTSSQVTEIMGCDSEKAIARQKDRGFVLYVVYDILYCDGISLLDLPWIKRRAYLEDCLENEIGLENKYIILSSYFECHKINAEQWYNEIVESGGEGVMLKNKNSKYDAGLDKMKKPSNTWIKVKKWITEDCIIMGFTDAEVEYTGKEIETWKYWVDDKPVTKYHYNGWIGACIFGQYDKKGNLIEVGQCSGMTEEIRQYMSENKEKLIGNVIEVKAMERISKTNALRHPEFLQIRSDKSPDECTIY